MTSGHHAPKPRAPACERNRDPILEVLRVHFAEAMPWLVWQCSDRADYLPGIGAWLDEAALPNTPPPLQLDVSQNAWPASAFDAAFSANTLHIMRWPEVEACFAGLDQVLAADATLAVYGPFNYGGEFTSDSNRAFDASLKARDPGMGIRDAAAVDALARAIGLRLLDDIAMPANNRCRVWRR